MFCTGLNLASPYHFTKHLDVYVNEHESKFLVKITLLLFPILPSQCGIQLNTTASVV
jgi:hypothetical protein